MITTLEHGVTVHDDAEGAIVQNLDVEEVQEESNLKGMVEGRTQVVRSWLHSIMLKFSVTGSGDLTLETGEDGDAQVSLISGGLTNILSFKLSEKLASPSEWTYSGNNYPHATANA
jgi:hypothetical protein